MLSRVADSLYWMSRYLERAEHTARLLDVQLNLTLEDAPGIRSGQRWGRLLRSLNMTTPACGLEDNFGLTHALTFDVNNPASIVSCISSARENARQVRELISTEMWMQLNRLYLDVKERDTDTIWNAQPHAFFLSIKEGAQLFQGITDDTLVRGEGWQFIQLGRYIERCMSLTSLLNINVDVFLDAVQQKSNTAHTYFERLSLLKNFTAFEAYTKVCSADLESEDIATFLLFDAEFPHTACFCSLKIKHALDLIGEKTGRRAHSKADRLAGKLYSSLSFDQFDEAMDVGFSNYLIGINNQCGQIHNAIYEIYINYPIASALM